MNSFKTDDKGFTGLEAAIVLIAFVVVAAVFSYVVLGAGFFTTQKAQETVYKGVEQSTTNIQMIGNVYGLASTSMRGIDQITVHIGLAPGAPSINLKKMNIIVLHSNHGPKTLVWEMHSSTPTRTLPCVKWRIVHQSQSTMTAGDQMEIAST